MNNSGGRRTILLLYKSFLPQMARIWGFLSTFGETEARQHLVTFLCSRSLLDLGTLCGNHVWEGVLHALGDSRLLQRLLAAQSLHLQSVDCLGPHPTPPALPPLGQEASSPRDQVCLRAHTGARRSHQVALFCICGSVWCNRLEPGLSRIQVPTSDAPFTTWCWGDCIQGVEGSTEASSRAGPGCSSPHCPGLRGGTPVPWVVLS